MASACVVTDKIEFKDAVNVPVEVKSHSPPNDETLSVSLRHEFEFSVTVWDPDVDDLENPDMRGKLVINSEFVAGQLSKRCPGPSYQESDSEEHLFKIDCPYNLPPQDSLMGRDLTVELIVSDRGFDQNQDPREGARVTSVTWTIRVEEE
jgi:hypothetical protein